MGNASSWVQTSIFLDILGQSHQDDRKHEDPGQTMIYTPLEVQIGNVGHILSQIFILLLLACICFVP
jgi:hypothetical protein